MEENNYRRLGEQYEEDIGGTKFIVTSYSNQSAQKTSEQLIMVIIRAPSANALFHLRTVRDWGARRKFQKRTGTACCSLWKAAP